MRTLPHQGWKPAAQHWKLVPGRHQQALSLRGGYCDIPSGLKEAVNPSLCSDCSYCLAEGGSSMLGHRVYCCFASWLPGGLGLSTCTAGVGSQGHRILRLLRPDRLHNERGRGREGKSTRALRTSSSQRSPGLDHRPGLLTQAIDLLIQVNLETWIVM